VNGPYSTNSKRAARGSVPIVILSTADFDAAVWTNKQHLALGLANYAPIYYVESFGLREPGVNPVDLKRALSKIKSATNTRRRAGHDPTKSHSTRYPIKIITPHILPLHRFRCVRWINQQIINHTVRAKLRDLGEYIFWTFSPITYRLESEASLVVYHSVDLLHEIPGVPKRALVESEKLLIADSDFVVASSIGVAQHLKDLGGATHRLWENVASVELFGSSRTDRKNRAIFAGNLTPTKVDVELLKGIASEGMELALAGPLSIDGIDSDKEFTELFDLPEVTYLGNLALDDLAREVANSTVGLIPYNINSYTDGVFPMKVYEYLSAGLQVVSTPLPSLREKKIDGLSVVQRVDFVATVKEAYEGFTEDAATERARSAQPYSWTQRIFDAATLLGYEPNKQESGRV